MSGSYSQPLLSGSGNSSTNVVIGSSNKSGGTSHLYYPPTVASSPPSNSNNSNNSNNNSNSNAGTGSPLTTPPHSSAYASSARYRYTDDGEAAEDADRQLLSPHTAGHIQDERAQRLLFQSPARLGLGSFAHNNSNNNGSHPKSSTDASDGSSSTVNGSTLIKATPSKHPRLLSLDAFRGMVIMWMIFADDVTTIWGGHGDHAPWNGFTFADFVFPSFVFITAQAIPLATSKIKQSKLSTSWTVFVRFFKLFLLGYFLVGDGFPNNYNLPMMRIPGILQRIGWCYFCNALIFIWTPVYEGAPSSSSQSSFWLYSKYRYHFIAGLSFLFVYVILMTSTAITDIPGCGRNDWSPNCNAAGYWDRQILGLNRMYNQPTYQRTPDCSTCSPAQCAAPPNAPAWCQRPFDPEGIVSSLSAVTSGFFGLFFGIIIANEKTHQGRLKQFIPLASVSLIFGIILHFTLVPFNKNLWTPSYVFLMVGIDGLIFSFYYFMVDMVYFHRLFLPLIAMGMNGLFVFLGAAAGLADVMITWVYINEPQNNLSTYFVNHVLYPNFKDNDLTTLAMGIIKVIFWLIVSLVLYHKKIFFKV